MEPKTYDILIKDGRNKWSSFIVTYDSEANLMTYEDYTFAIDESKSEDENIENFYDWLIDNDLI